MPLRLTIITPERVVYEGDVEQVTLPTMAGEITVLPGHIPVITTIAPGTLLARAGNDTPVFAVARGIILFD